MKSDSGFSMVELLVAMLILIPLMGAAISMFSVGARQQVTEQGSIDVNQDARAGMDMMIREISQAGAHKDVSTTLQSAVDPGTPPYTVKTATLQPQQDGSSSTAGMMVGEWVDIGAGNPEHLTLTAVGPNTISCVFTQSHAVGTSVNYFAQPYLNGVIPPPGMIFGQPTPAQAIRFFGDINDDSILEYVEYTVANDQITRSLTPVTAGAMAPARPFIRNIRPGSAQFILNSNDFGIITSVEISLTVVNTATEQNGQRQSVSLSSRALIPNAAAATMCRQLTGTRDLAPTPDNVKRWANIN